jgi:hypothetical protein
VQRPLSLLVLKVTKHSAQCTVHHPSFSTCSPLLCTPAMYLHTQVIPTFASGSLAPKASCAVPILDELTLTSSLHLGIDHRRYHIINSKTCKLQVFLTQPYSPTCPQTTSSRSRFLTIAAYPRHTTQATIFRGHSFSAPRQCVD